MTIYDLSKKLNISPSTISKALNNTGHVNENTKRRILSYVEKVGYVPSTSARQLKSEKSYTIGVIFTEELHIGLENVFFASILQHFKEEAERKGYELSFIVTQLGKNKLTYYQWCRNRKVDGVFIVIGDGNDEGIIDLSQRNIPIVSSDVVLKNVKSIISNNWQGTTIALDHLFKDCKLSKVGMIHGPHRSYWFKQRYLAYYDYFEKNNLEINEDYIIETKSYGFSSGYEACLEIINKNKDNLPEGIIVGSDEIASGVIKCLNDHQIKIPDQVQIVGFDDITYARFLTPSLTTIKQDTYKIGTFAAESLIKLIEDKNYDMPDYTNIDVSLVVRESTKPIKEE